MPLQIAEPGMSRAPHNSTLSSVKRLMGRSLAEDGKALLSPPERAAIAQGIYAVADLIETGGDAPDGGLEALKTATAGLNAAPRDFAARRMDAGVRRAFAGQRVDLLEGV